MAEHIERLYRGHLYIRWEDPCQTLLVCPQIQVDLTTERFEKIINFFNIAHVEMFRHTSPIVVLDIQNIYLIKNLDFYKATNKVLRYFFRNWSFRGKSIEKWLVEVEEKAGLKKSEMSRLKKVSKEFV